MEEMIELNSSDFYGVNDLEKLKIAENIITTKLADWAELAKKYEDEKTAELIFGFHGEVIQMLSQVCMGKFMYDPQTVADSVDMIFDVLESAKKGNHAEAKETYLNFEDFRTRAVYLYSIINHLNVFKSIGNEVVNDFEMLKTVATDEEIWLMLDNEIRNVKTQMELENKNAQNLENAPAKA